MSHLLDASGVPAKMPRTTWLSVGARQHLGPKLVAAAFGVRPEGAMIYLGDHLDTQSDSRRTVCVTTKPGQHVQLRPCRYTCLGEQVRFAEGPVGRDDQGTPLIATGN